MNCLKQKGVKTTKKQYATCIIRLSPKRLHAGWLFPFRLTLKRFLFFMAL